MKIQEFPGGPNRFHQQDVKEFQNEAENGNHEEVKNFASKTLPTLQEHLSMAKDLNKQKGDAAMK